MFKESEGDWCKGDWHLRSQSPVRTKGSDRSMDDAGYLKKKQKGQVEDLAIVAFFWSGKRDSNPRPSAWEADTLPLSYSRLNRVVFVPHFTRSCQWFSWLLVSF